MTEDSNTGVMGYSGLLDRGLAIIELLTSHAEGLSLTVISERLRIPRSATHRLLIALSERGFVRQRLDRGTYLLTSKLQILAFSHLASSGVVDAAQPVLDRLATDVGELVRLSVVDGDTLTWVARAQGAQFGLRYDPDMGKVVRLSCSASGFAWLATLSDDEAVARVDAQGYGATQDYGPAAPANRVALLQQLVLSRRQGYAIAIRTFSDWMGSVARAVIHPTTGLAIGVLSIAGPVSRLPTSRLHDIAPLLCDAADEISQLIPGSPALTSPGIAVRDAHQGQPS